MPRLKRGKLYLSLFSTDDGQILPHGYVTETAIGGLKEIEDRLTLALEALRSMGFDAQFAETPGDASGRMPEGGYEEV